MNNKLITICITLVVGVILAGSVLMPILQDATTTEKTFTNVGYYYMTDLGEDSIVYTYDGTKWTIDGEETTISNSEATTLVAGDGFIVRANGQLRGSTIASPASISNLTVTATGLSMSYTKPDETTATATVSGTVYYCAVNEKTDHTLSRYNVPVYVNGDSDILADGMSGIATNVTSVFKIEGNIDDGFTVTPQNAGVTVSDVTCNYTAVQGYNDLYQIESITFNTTYNDVVRVQSYSSYVAPTEVTAEKSQHLNNGEIALISAIPIMVIIALVMVAVGSLYFGRND